jgi:hypothetical protein
LSFAAKLLPAKAGNGRVAISFIACSRSMGEANTSLKISASVRLEKLPGRLISSANAELKRFFDLLLVI